MSAFASTPAAGSPPPSSPTLAAEVRRIVGLAYPLVTAQVAAMFLWVVDTLMLGQVGVEALGGASLGRTWVYGTLIFAMGLVLGIDPIAAQAFGAGDRRALTRVLQQGVLVALAVSVPVGFLWLFTEPILRWAAIEPGLAAVGADYTRAQIPGLPLFLAFIAVRHWLQAQGVMRPIMWISLASNLVNVFANWVLIFGNLGFPAYGATGAGAATSITFAFLLTATCWVAGRVARDRGFDITFRASVLRLDDYGAIGRFGVPVGFQIGLEFWAFSLSTLWAGWLGAEALAAHTIAITLASLTFMVPLGTSFASAARVGNLIGAGDPEGARRASWASLVVAGVFMAVAAAVFVAGRWWFPTLFTDDAGVIALTAAILPIAAAFQLSDGFQAIGSGVLRGIGDTLPAAAFNFIGYYLVALPLGWWLTFRTDLGLAGLWWAMALGLTLVAGMMVAWIRWRGPGAGGGFKEES